MQARAATAIPSQYLYNQPKFGVGRAHRASMPAGVVQPRFLRERVPPVAAHRHGYRGRGHVRERALIVWS